LLQKPSGFGLSGSGVGSEIPEIVTEDISEEQLPEREREETEKDSF
jgi:hypothetical protein